MEIIVFEKGTYFQMVAEMKQSMNEAMTSAFKQAMKEAIASYSEPPENDWIGAEEAKKLLRIKAKSTLQELRDEGKIEFSQYGRVIQYSKKSIMEFIQKHRVKKWN